VRRRLAHLIWIVVRAAGVAALVVTIGFDDFAAGTVVSNEYDVQGVDSRAGIGINARITGVCCSLCVPWGVG
jgi:hypothetical protein